VNRATGAPLNSIDPQQISLGVQYDTAAWGLRADLRHHGAKKASDIDSASAVKAPNTQFTIGQATTLDLSAQWRLQQGPAAERCRNQRHQPQILALARRLWPGRVQHRE
jgi:hypothetical protein